MSSVRLGELGIVLYGMGWSSLGMECLLLLVLVVLPLIDWVLLAAWSSLGWWLRCQFLPLHDVEHGGFNSR